MRVIECHEVKGQGYNANKAHAESVQYKTRRPLSRGRTYGKTKQSIYLLLQLTNPVLLGSDLA